MVRDVLIAGMRRIDAAGLRSFKQGQEEILFQDLKHLDDNTFNILVCEFLEVEQVPKSLTGWFLKRAREINESANRKNIEMGGWKEYTQEDLKLFFKCVQLALRVFKTKTYTETKETGPSEYANWMRCFSDHWLEPGFMQLQYKELEAA